MSNPISNRSLSYNLETPDVGKTTRKHRAGEVMTNLYDVLNGIVISATMPALANRFVGMIWVDTSGDIISVYMADKNKEFTINLGGG